MGINVQTWAVSNQKGGVGKTTTVVSLAGLLAAMGKRVLMVDLDPHGSLTSYFGFDPDTIENSAYRLFHFDAQVPRAEILTCVLETQLPNLHVMPASTALATLERQMVGKSGMGLKIATGLNKLKSDYDFVLLDSPPVLGVLMINALAAAQHLVVPVQTEFLAMKGLERMVRTMQMVTKAQKHHLPFTIVPTMYDRRTQASVGSLRALRNAYPDNIWAAMIPVDTRFRDASRVGLPIGNYDANSRGTDAYKSLLKTLLKASEA